MANSSIIKAGNKILNDIEEKLDDVCKLIIKDAVINCGVDTGQLRASWDIEKSDRKRVISFNSEYALYHHNGTGIYAKDGNGRQEAWTYKNSHGKWVRTRGSKPNPFLAKAFNKNKKNIAKILSEV